MATVLLVRHGQSTANASGTLAGRAAGVDLDETGRTQVTATAERLAAVPLIAVVSSPLDRCAQTAQAIADHQSGRPGIVTEADLTECDYGQWQGRSLADLAKEDLWPVVQSHPASVVFPGGESLAAMQARAVASIRRHDAHTEAQHGSAAVWAAVSHGDLIKAILADALGMHLDLFQRLHVDPASVSIVRYGTSRPEVLAMNTVAPELSWLAGSGAPQGGQVGGGAGPGAQAPAAS